MLLTPTNFIVPLPPTISANKPQSLTRNIKQQIDSSFSKEILQNKQNSNQVFIKLESVNLGSFKLEPGTRIKACIGSRSNIKGYPVEFNQNTVPNHVWTFSYKNLLKSSFVLVLFQSQFLGPEKEIGEIEIRLSAFQKNSVTSHEFILRSPNRNAVPPRVRLSVHVNEDGSNQFSAPNAHAIDDKFEIVRRTSYAE